MMPTSAGVMPHGALVAIDVKMPNVAVEAAICVR